MLSISRRRSLGLNLQAWIASDLLPAWPVDLMVSAENSLLQPLLSTFRARKQGLLLDTVADGSWAVGLFNLSAGPASVQVSGSDFGGLSGAQRGRDLWRQKDLDSFPDHFSTTVTSHGVAPLEASRGS